MGDDPVFAGASKRTTALPPLGTLAWILVGVPGAVVFALGATSTVRALGVEVPPVFVAVTSKVYTVVGVNFVASPTALWNVQDKVAVVHNVPNAVAPA